MKGYARSYQVKRLKDALRNQARWLHTLEEAVGDLQAVLETRHAMSLPEPEGAEVIEV